MRCPVSRNPDCFAQYREFDGKETGWWCISRRRPLIGRSVEMLSIPHWQSNIPRLVDWSSRDIICIGFPNGLMIGNSNDSTLAILQEEEHPSAIRWSNDGTRVACTFPNLKVLKLYSLKKKKCLWSAACVCLRCNLSRCANSCICWSHDDRQIVTGCNGFVSVYASDSGKLILDRAAYSAHILTLSISPNSKHLVSTAQDKILHVFTWPDVTNHYDIEYAKPIEAVAWHPKKPALLCVGSKDYETTLSLWNINTAEMINYVFNKSKGSVENLAWNKLSGELVVHWSFKEDGRQYNVLPVFSGFGRIVDAVPLDKTARLSFFGFNATHEKLVTYCNDDMVSIWDFFGNEKPPQRRCFSLYTAARRRDSVIVRDMIR